MSSRSVMPWSRSFQSVAAILSIICLISSMVFSSVRFIGRRFGTGVVVTLSTELNRNSKNKMSGYFGCSTKMYLLGKQINVELVAQT